MLSKLRLSICRLTTAQRQAAALHTHTQLQLLRLLWGTVQVWAG